jgi:hypothetical protein
VNQVTRIITTIEPANPKAADELLLLSGYEGMKQREDRIPADNKRQMRETLQRIVQLYVATGRPDQATEWRQKLAGFDKAETTKKADTPSTVA